MTKDDARLILIKKGILIKKYLPITDFNKDGNRLYYSLTDDFENQFLGYVFDIVQKNIKMLSKHHYDIIINQLNSFPDDVRREKIILKIESILKEISPYVLDYESKRCMVLDFFDYTDFLKFHEGDLKVLKNEYLKDYIREENLREVIKLLKNECQSKKPKRQKKTSYVWSGNLEEELPDLYSLMINKYNLIAPETSYEQFKAIFTGQQIIDDFEPIKWMESNRLLAYFLDAVFIGQEWQSIAGNGKLFKNIKNKQITANDLSVAKQGFVGCGKPKGYEKIDFIVKSIQK
jgi:hypothetical protein